MHSTTTATTTITTTSHPPNPLPAPSPPPPPPKAVVELQRRCRDARVLYVSATGATESENLCYMERLGLWGPGTAYPGKQQFVTMLKTYGVRECWDGSWEGLLGGACLPTVRSYREETATHGRAEPGWEGGRGGCWWESGGRFSQSQLNQDPIAVTWLVAWVGGSVAVDGAGHGDAAGSCLWG